MLFVGGFRLLAEAYRQEGAGRDQIDRFMKKAEESAAASLVIPPRVYSVGEHTFMISTPINDLRILRSIDIGFFRYNATGNCGKWC